ncbi:MAG TPA: glycolate oxidase subunit GlcE [Burkholderiales bacterium]
MTDKDLSADLAEAVRAAGSGSPLRIVSGGTKDFYGRAPRGEPLQVAGHRGIVSYEPTELVITARAGTPLAEIEAALAAQGQRLAFEPPYFGEAATLGGTLACGFSGPARPYTGSARDFVLGAKIINGKGEILSFGGQVMKNVAGYDISRFMVGALGTLGVLLEASLKVLPRPEAEMTLRFELPAERAIAEMNAWAARPLPLSAACHLDGVLYVRLSGTAQTLRAARTKMGGEDFPDAARFWEALREHRLDFFATEGPLWRLSVPPATPPMALAGEWLIDWGGAQRWLKTSARATDVWAAAAGAGGHATLFRGGDRAGEVFQPLPPPLQLLHRRLKHAFDPGGVLNPGRFSTAW